MDRGAWQATVHGVARVRHDLATTPPPPHYHMDAPLKTDLQKPENKISLTPLQYMTTLLLQRYPIKLLRCAYIGGKNVSNRKK